MRNAWRRLGKLRFHPSTAGLSYLALGHLGDLYPGNQNVRPKMPGNSSNICATADLLISLSRGNYRLK